MTSEGCVETRATQRRNGTGGVHFNWVHACACMDRRARITHRPHHHHHHPPPPTTTTTRARRFKRSYTSDNRSLLLSQAGAMFGARDDGEGAARRRRERRLRSWLKHERLSVAMALSEYKHHSSRGQRKDRAGEEGHRDENVAPRRQKPPPPQGLGEPRGLQARVQKHTMEQLAHVLPMVQILDSPVPQMVDTVLDFFRSLDLPFEQVTAVPKISLDRIPQRSADLVPQMMEQLVEVPTVLTLSSLQQTAKQIVDIVVFRVLSQDRVQQRLVLCKS